jgi:hypothetical protein
VPNVQFQGFEAVKSLKGYCLARCHFFQKRLKHVICKTGRKRKVAAGHDVFKTTIWKIELYKGSVFQTGF